MRYRPLAAASVLSVIFSPTFPTPPVSAAPGERAPHPAIERFVERYGERVRGFAPSASALDDHDAFVVAYTVWQTDRLNEALALSKSITAAYERNPDDALILFAEMRLMQMEGAVDAVLRGNSKLSKADSMSFMRVDQVIWLHRAMLGKIREQSVRHGADAARKMLVDFSSNSGWDKISVLPPAPTEVDTAPKLLPELDLLRFKPRTTDLLPYAAGTTHAESRSLVTTFVDLQPISYERSAPPPAADSNDWNSPASWRRRRVSAVVMSLASAAAAALASKIWFGGLIAGLSAFDATPLVAISGAFAASGFALAGIISLIARSEAAKQKPVSVDNFWTAAVLWSIASALAALTIVAASAHGWLPSFITAAHAHPLGPGHRLNFTRSELVFFFAILGAAITALVYLSGPSRE